jgi:hypothetical protein
MKTLRFAIALLLMSALAGCRSHVVKVNLVNISTEPVKTIIVDYPAATFGKDALAPGATFSYAIKPLETGMFKVQFTDAKGVIHSYTGTTLHKNDDGVIDVSISQGAAVVTAKLGS